MEQLSSMQYFEAMVILKKGIEFKIHISKEIVFFSVHFFHRKRKRA
jgi:hypothetical protein